MRTKLKNFTLLILSLVLTMGIMPIFGGGGPVFASIEPTIYLQTTVGEEFEFSKTVSDQSGINLLYLSTYVIKNEEGTIFPIPPENREQGILNDFGLKENGIRDVDQASKKDCPPTATLTISGKPTKSGKIEFYIMATDYSNNPSYFPVVLIIKNKDITPSDPIPDPDPNPSLKESFTITFDPADGRWEDGSTDPIVMDCKQGDVITIPEAPRKAGAKFLYWEGSHYYPGEEYVVEGDHTFTARYDDLPEVDTYLLYEAVNGTPEIQPTQTTISTMPAETNPVPSKPVSPQNLPKTGEQAAYTPFGVTSVVAGLGLVIAVRKKLGK